MHDKDYLTVLNALREIPFGVGKKLLIDFLQGDEENESIARNRLYAKEHFGSLAYSDEEIDALIDRLLRSGLLQLSPVNGNRFWKVLTLTTKGQQELLTPTFHERKLFFKDAKPTVLSEQDKKLCTALGDFLEPLNDQQKKAVISPNAHILCVAGAGSGKTAVLAKRAEFLVRYRSVDSQKILAVTFTRKARQEMIRRLAAIPFVEVETFNSFCERILKQHNNLIYDKPVRVISYRDKAVLVSKALTQLNTNMREALAIYFGEAQQRGKTEEQLATIFLNDCFFIRDYFKSKNKPIEIPADPQNQKSAALMVSVCRSIDSAMQKFGLRDFADQLLDTLELFEHHKELIPPFEHILVDEYQDVNATQVRLLDLLSPRNLFCVGDPRQSIYGWRGSDLSHIISYEEKYPDCEIVSLTKNYRSTPDIVHFVNQAIKDMGLADLESANEKKEKDIHLFKFDSEEAEYEFVAQAILTCPLPRNQIFVLARTNRQLNELSKMMRARGIKHVLRSDEIRKSVIAAEDDVTLATIHAIKGLEAEMVFVVGCNGSNFPCKASEHPIFELITVEDYDKEDEERRLFYVAMSRAKSSLFLTYTGKKPTSFITPNMLTLLQRSAAQTTLATGGRSRSTDVMRRLSEWRKELSEQHHIPAFMILHDRTLMEIAQTLPLTARQLEDIKGLGPAKIARYGQDILRIVGS